MPTRSRLASRAMLSGLRPQTPRCWAGGRWQPDSPDREQVDDLSGPAFKGLEGRPGRYKTTWFYKTPG
jgi:hypothetical protein